jgi:hypothetical protein
MPHTPHGWDVHYEESTQTLICGDLQPARQRALTDGDIVGPAIAAEDTFNLIGSKSDKPGRRSIRPFQRLYFSPSQT